MFTNLRYFPFTAKGLTFFLNYGILIFWISFFLCNFVADEGGVISNNQYKNCYDLYEIICPHGIIASWRYCS